MSTCDTLRFQIHTVRTKGKIADVMKQSLGCYRATHRVPQPGGSGQKACLSSADAMLASSLFAAVP